MIPILLVLAFGWHVGLASMGYASGGGLTYAVSIIVAYRVMLRA